jgi:hypothetical protein
MGFEQQVDQWREFYLAVAGAAAVLLGLVFVALSLHVEPPAGIEPATPSLPFVLPGTCSKASAGQRTVSVRG